mgnify:CR=1 FL=1
MKKEDVLRELRENKEFKDILSAASDDKERKFIKAHTENFILNFYNNVLEPLQKILENNPDALNKAVSEFESVLINSGSIGQ